MVQSWDSRLDRRFNIESADPFRLWRKMLLKVCMNAPA